MREQFQLYNEMENAIRIRAIIVAALANSAMRSTCLPAKYAPITELMTANVSIAQMFSRKSLIIFILYSYSFEQIYVL